MKKIIYSVACVVALASVAEAQQKTSPVAIAEGWVQDNSRNAAQLARESFIKADEVGEIGNGIIYLREVGLDEELTSLKEVVDLDTKMFTLNKTTVQVKDAGKIVLADKKTTSVVKYITGGSDAQFQAIAYIPEKGSVVTLTLATYSKEFFEDHLTDFNKMVSSYSKEVSLTPIVSEGNLH